MVKRRFWGAHLTIKRFFCFLILLQILLAVFTNEKYSIQQSTAKHSNMWECMWFTFAEEEREVLQEIQEREDV